MAADAGIFQQYLKPVRSVADYRGDIDKQEQNALTLAAARQSASDDQAVRQVYMKSGGNIDNKLVQALSASGNYKAAQAAQKQLLETQKTQGDIGLTKAKTAESAQKTDTGAYEMQVKKHDKAITDIAALQDPQTAHSSIDAHLASGDIDQAKAQALHASIPQDPAQFSSWQVNMLRGILTAKDQLGQVSPDANARLSSQTSLATNAATNATSRANNASTVGATMRGQNMTDGRAREANKAAALSQPFTVSGPDGNDMLVQQNKANGQLLPVQGGFAPKSQDKALTDGQAKALAFAARMQASDGIINDLSAKGKNFSTPGARTGFGVGSLVNTVNSGEGQQLDQAKRDFINAVLRRESGAVISDMEFGNAEKQYFPQIGDSAAVIKQKANNRRISLEGMKADVPTAKQGKIDEIANGAKSSADGWKVEKE